MEERQHNDIYAKLGKLEGLMQEMHETHNVNRDNINRTLEQALKTNGRVTNIEAYIVEQHKINSKLNGMLEAQHIRLEEQEKRHSYSMGVLKALGVLGSIVFVMGGYIFTLIIKDINRKSFEENEPRIQEISRQSVREVLSDYDIIIEK
jgi:hypothetical protein